MKNILTLLIFIIFLSSCTSGLDEITVARQNTVTFIPSSTATATVESRETTIARIKVTKTARVKQTKVSKDVTSTALALTPSSTPEPTRTPRPTSTSTITPITANPELSDFMMPVWVKNTSNNILLSLEDIDGSRDAQIRMVNSQTGDHLDIDVQREFYFYYWKDFRTITFLQGGDCLDPPTTIFEIDIWDYSLKEFDAYYYPDKIRNCYSYANENIAIDYDAFEPFVTVTDTVSGEAYLLTNPNDGIVDISFRVSPDKKFVAVSQAAIGYEYSEIWIPYVGNQISIYRLSDQTLVMTITEDVELASITFLPDSNKIIYLREDTPCLIVVSSKSKKCIHNIPQAFPDSRIYLGEPLQDSQLIGFIYLNNNIHHGGVCFYDLVTGEINCPTDNFDELNEFSIINYSLSPDDKYLLIIYDGKGCPWCDYARNPQIAVMDFSGTEMHYLGDSLGISHLPPLWWSDKLDSTWQPLNDDE